MLVWIRHNSGIKRTLAGHAVRPCRLRLLIQISIQLLLPKMKTFVTYSGRLLYVAWIEAGREAGGALYCPNRRVHGN